MKFCTKQFLCDLFLPKEILIGNHILIDLKMNIQWQSPQWLFCVRWKENQSLCRMSFWAVTEADNALYLSLIAPEVASYIDRYLDTSRARQNEQERERERERWEERGREREREREREKKKRWRERSQSETLYKRVSQWFVFPREILMWNFIPIDLKWKISWH